MRRPLLLLLAAVLLPAAANLAAAPVADGWNSYGKGELKILGTTPLRLALDNRRTGLGNGISRTAATVPGELWELSVRARATAPNAPPLLLQLRFLPGKKIVQQAFPLTGGEQTVSIAAQAPAGSTSVTAYLYHGPAAAARFELAAPQLSTRAKISFDAGDIAPRRRELTLLRQGEANCLIVTPADGSLDGTAAELAGLFDGKVPIRHDEPERRPGQVLLLLGHRNNNPVISALYDRYYCVLDRSYPGRGGHLLRTLFDPAGDGVDYILLGGSDDDGVRTAAAKLAGRLVRDGSEIRCPFTWDLAMDPACVIPDDYDVCDTWDQSAGYGPRYFGWCVLSRLMALFHATGDEKYAREFLELAFPATPEAKKRIGRDPVAFRRHEDPIGSVYHYNAPMLSIYWNLIEHHPFFSESDRRRVVAAFFRQYEFFRDDQANGCGVYQTVAPRDRVGNRHQQWAAISLLTLSRYLAKTLPGSRADFRWAEQGVHHFFASLDQHAAVEGEGGNLTWYPTGAEPVPFYLLLSGRRRPVENGVLRRLYENVQTLGGNTPDDRILRYVPLSFLRRTAYLLGDEQPLELERILSPPARFRLGQSFEPAPGEYAKRTPLPHGDWRFIRQEPPAPDTFVIASYSGAPLGGDRIVLDGFLEPQLRQPLHNFAIFTLTLDGFSLLAGYRNQLWLRKNGLSLSKLPRAARRLADGVVGDTVFFAASVPAAERIDWRRTLLRRSRFALVVDEAVNRGRQQEHCDLAFHWEVGPEVRPEAAGPGRVALKLETDRTADYRFRLGPDDGERQAADGVETVRLAAPAALLAKCRADGDSLVYTFQTGEATTGEAVIRFYGFRDRGVCRVELDGRELHPGFDARRDRAEVLTLPLGQLALPPGEHQLRLTAQASPGHPDSRSIAFVSFGLRRAGETPQGALLFAGAATPELEEHGEVPLDRLSGRVVRFRQARTLPPDGRSTDFTLLAAVGPEQIRITGRTAHALCFEINGQPHYAAAGPAGENAAAWLLATADFLTAGGLTRAGALLAADRPVDLDWDFAAGELRIRTAADTTLRLAGRTHRLAPGHHTLTARPEPGSFRLPTPPPAATTATTTAEPPAAGAATAPMVELDGSRQRFDGYPGVMRQFVRRGEPRLALANGRTVRLLAADGEVVRSLTADATVGALHYDTENDQLLAGCADDQLIAFDLDSGARRWTHRSQMAPEIGRSGAVWFQKSALPGVWGVNAGRLAADGPAYVFAGGASTLEVLSADGQPVRTLPVLWGPVSRIALFSPDGNADRTVACAQVYPGYEYLTLYDRHWNRQLGYNTPPPEAEHFRLWSNVNRTGILVADLDGDGEEWIVSGINGFWNRIIVWDRRGRANAEVSFGPGDPIRVPPYGRDRLEKRFLADVRLLPEPGGVRIVAAVEDGIFKFDRALKPLFRQLPPSPPLVLATAPNRIAAGCRNGEIPLYDGAGRPLGTARMDAPVAALEFVGDVLFAAAANGELLRLETGGNKK